MALSAKAVDGFTGGVLSKGFDAPRPSPKFHEEMWEMCCSDAAKVAIAAPRGHAKSTAITFSYTLAELMFRESSFVVIISATEGMAQEYLGHIKRELVENADLIAHFDVGKIEKDTATDFVCQFKNGDSFRVIAKGAEQKLRGMLWRGKRPDLVICDDMEEDEQVMNRERREKFRSWFFNAVLPMLARNGKIRVVGTILHLDSLLERLLQNEAWKTARYQAHDSNFENILWPEMFSAEYFREKRREYVSEGNLQGYSQEYLNWPIDEENALFRKADFLPMKPEDWNRNFNYYAAADFAISEKEKADYSVIIVAATDEEGYLYIVDRVKGRLDSQEIIEEMIGIQKRYQPDAFWVESEKIDKAIGPFLIDRMFKENTFINLIKKSPTKDKIQRAQSIAARMKMGGVKFHKEAEWYDDLESNLMKVTRSGVRGGHDDDLDAFAWIGLGLTELTDAPTARELEQEEWEDAEMDALVSTGNKYTGY